MRITKKNIERRLAILSKRVPLPEGYHYCLESSNPGDGRRYSFSVCRDDHQGGCMLSFPSMGSYKTADFYAVLGGMLDAVDLQTWIDAVDRKTWINARFGVPTEGV